MDFDPRETAHDKKRDKKYRQKYEMIVSSGGKKLAQILQDIKRKRKKSK